MNKATILAFIFVCVVFTILTVVHVTIMIKEKHFTSIDMLKPHPAIPRFIDSLFLFTAILISYIVEVFLTSYNIQTAYGTFIALFSYCWGLIAFCYELPNLASHVIQMNPTELMYIYIPILVFHRAFCLDVHIFLKTINQVLVIGVAVTLVTAALFGLLLAMMISSELSTKIAVLLGCYCAPIQPQKMIHLLKQQSSKSKRVSVLLEGEAVVCMLVVDLTHQMMIPSIVGITVHWYQHLMVFLRIIICSTALGFIAGYLGRFMIRKMYTERMCVMIICFALPFVTYCVSQKYVSGCGSISVMILGIMLGMERTALNKELEVLLTNYWELIAWAIDIVICTVITINVALRIAPKMHWEDTILIVVAYVVYYVMRFVAFLLFSPITSRMGYGMELKTIIVCVWGGLKSPFSLMAVYQFNYLLKYFVERRITNVFHFYIFGLFIYSLFLNATFAESLLNFLGLTKTLIARQINMNNCFKHIFDKRERIIAILKQDRFLADTNWPMVIESTNLQHPYHLSLDENEEDPFFLGYRFTTCPDCQKELLQEPSPKEMKEMTKEARMRVLKAKKMSFSRQFENGMITKEAIRILSQAVELAMDSEDATMQISAIKKRFVDQNFCEHFFQNRIEHMGTSSTIPNKPPNTYWRRVCYHIVGRPLFEKIMLLIILCNLGFTLAEIFCWQTDEIQNKSLNISLLAAIWIFTAIYILEFVMKIMAFSWIHVIAHGFRNYFKSWWHVMDFIVIIVYLVEVGSETYDVSIGFQSGFYNGGSFREVMDILTLSRYIRLLRFFEIFYPHFLNFLTKVSDEKMSFTYELGKSYVISDNEILTLLPYMIDNEKIRSEMKATIESDRKDIVKLIGVIQKERPWVTITVKTKQATRTVLSGMHEAIIQLKVAGWVDTYEQEKLQIEMNELYKKVNSLGMVQPSEPKVVFKEIAWMPTEEKVIDFLFENVSLKKFEPGDVLFAEGEKSDGIYIVVMGLFKIIYTPVKSTLEALHEYGLLPIVDYLQGTKFDEPIVDYIVSGNSVGELSTLTERPYNCTIVADGHSQVYFLSSEIMKQAMALNEDPVTGLQCRLWKEISLRIAFPLLLSVPAYQGFSQDQIKYALERAFVPDLSFVTVFTVTEIIQDVILVEGVAAEYNTREKFLAPCVIPRMVQKLILPKSSLMRLPSKTETKLLIIPEKDINEYDVMVLAEETCELVEVGSSQPCLQHRTARQRARSKRKLRQIKKGRIHDSSSVYTGSTGSGSMVYKSSFWGESSTMFMASEEAEEEEKAAIEQEELGSRGELKRRQTAYFD